MISQPRTVYDGDPKDKKLSVAVPGARSTSHGQVDLHADGSLPDTPKLGSSGSDGFSYRATNGSVLSQATQVDLKVDAEHQSPTGKPDTYHVEAGTCTPGAGFKGQDHPSYQDYDDSGLDGFSTPAGCHQRHDPLHPAPSDRRCRVRTVRDVFQTRH